MPNKIWFLHKAHLTFGTWILAITGMNSVLCDEVCPVGKTLSTFRTGIGIIARVDFLMPNQIWFLHKGPSTLIAWIGAVTRMNSVMHDKVLSVSKTLSTLWTWIWLLARVNLFVPNKRCFLGETPAVLQAWIQFLSRVSPLMIDEFSPVAKASFLAWERLLRSMNSLVNGEVGFFCETLFAFWARIRLLPVWLLLCVISCFFQVKNSSHAKSIFPMWDRRRELLCLKHLPQENGFSAFACGGQRLTSRWNICHNPNMNKVSPQCELFHVWWSYVSGKNFSHIQKNENGFSPVCVLWCQTKSCTKYFPHSEQENSLALPCLCFVSLEQTFLNKRFPTLSAWILLFWCFLSISSSVKLLPHSWEYFLPSIGGLMGGKRWMIIEIPTMCRGIGAQICTVNHWVALWCDGAFLWRIRCGRIFL